MLKLTCWFRIILEGLWVLEIPTLSANMYCQNMQEYTILTKNMGGVYINLRVFFNYMDSFHDGLFVVLNFWDMFISKTPLH